MNFVVIAPHFYPLPDPEAFCSTRFASALSRLGHTVEVVTDWQPEVMYEKSYSQLVHPNVKVTRVGPCERRPIDRLHVIDWKWLTVKEDQHDLIEPYLIATCTALKRYDRPVLVSRSFPRLSYLVGWHCRKSAAKWVAHFSDPMIDYERTFHLYYVLRWSHKWWMRRVMRHADAISITCKRVTWYYRAQLGSCVDKAKFILTPHIGDFKLERGEEGRATPRCILHDGDIYRGRGLLMVDAVDRLNAEGFPCLFLQGRDVKGDADRAKLLASQNCRIVGQDVPPELKALAKSAQVSFVADFDTPGLSYSPYLMSKFVYQLFTDKPIVVLSKLESEKHDYCAAYPEAGLFFAEIGKVETLVAAVKAAFSCDPLTIDRTRIRQIFSEETIGEHFVREIESISPKR